MLSFESVKNSAELKELKQNKEVSNDRLLSSEQSELEEKEKIPKLKLK